MKRRTLAFFSVSRSVLTSKLIVGGDIYVKRPFGKSRVYSNVTNLDREFRDHLLLDGKHLVGSDLRNSQPLIASVLFTRYWQRIEPGQLPPDVIEGTVYRKVS